MPQLPTCADLGPGVHDKHQEMGVKSRHRSFPGGFFNRITVTTLPETNSDFAPENRETPGS